MGLEFLHAKGAITGHVQIQSCMPGLRWTLTPTGFGERAMTTNEVEWFILGAQASFNTKRGVYR